MPCDYVNSEKTIVNCIKKKHTDYLFDEKITCIDIEYIKTSTNIFVFIAKYEGYHICSVKLEDKSISYRFESGGHLGVKLDGLPKDAVRYRMVKITKMLIKEVS